MSDLLTTRQLNRIFLARQLLLERSTLSPLAAAEQLIALQSQIPNPPYIGLWTRLKQFARDDLTALMETRQIVRAPFLRSTLHLLSAADHQRFRCTLQPALEKGFRSFFGKRIKGLDIDKLLTAAELFLIEAPRSTGEIRQHLLQIEPDADPAALSYAIRTYLPYVQVPPGGTWGVGTRASYTTAAHWLGPVDEQAHIQEFFCRYLAANGPASIMDFQTWAGMTRLKKPLEKLRPELRTFTDENGQELFDLPDAPLPDADTPTPIRFIPEYDNLLIAHRDRNRILPDEHYKKVFLSAARVRSTILVDGFVAGAWALNRDKETATLTIEPFIPLTAATQEALAAEGETLTRFIEEDAQTIQIEFTPVL